MSYDSYVIVIASQSVCFPGGQKLKQDAFVQMMEQPFPEKRKGVPGPRHLHPPPTSIHLSPEANRQWSSMVRGATHHFVADFNDFEVDLRWYISKIGCAEALVGCMSYPSQNICHDFDIFCHLIADFKSFHFQAMEAWNVVDINGDIEASTAEKHLKASTKSWQLTQWAGHQISQSLGGQERICWLLLAVLSCYSWEKYLNKIHLIFVIMYALLHYQWIPMIYSGVVFKGQRPRFGLFQQWLHMSGLSMMRSSKCTRWASLSDHNANAPMMPTSIFALSLKILIQWLKYHWDRSCKSFRPSLLWTWTYQKPSRCLTLMVMALWISRKHTRLPPGITGLPLGIGAVERSWHSWPWWPGRSWGSLILAYRHGLRIFAIKSAGHWLESWWWCRMIFFLRFFVLSIFTGTLELGTSSFWGPAKLIDFLASQQKKSLRAW